MLEPQAKGEEVVGQPPCKKTTLQMKSWRDFAQRGEEGKI
jgi:hypothetical protein